MGAGERLDEEGDAVIKKTKDWGESKESADKSEKPKGGSERGGKRGKWVLPAAFCDDTLTKLTSGFPQISVS